MQGTGKVSLEEVLKEHIKNVSVGIVREVLPKVILDLITTKYEGEIEELPTIEEIESFLNEAILEEKMLKNAFSYGTADQQRANGSPFTPGTQKPKPVAVRKGVPPGTEDNWKSFMDLGYDDKFPSIGQKGNPVGCIYLYCGAGAKTADKYYTYCGAMTGYPFCKKHNKGVKIGNIADSILTQKLTFEEYRRNNTLARVRAAAAALKLPVPDTYEEIVKENTRIHLNANHYPVEGHKDSILIESGEYEGVVIVPSGDNINPSKVLGRVVDDEFEEIDEDEEEELSLKVNDHIHSLIPKPKTNPLQLKPLSSTNPVTGKPVLGKQAPSAKPLTSSGVKQPFSTGTGPRFPRTIGTTNNTTIN